MSEDNIDRWLASLRLDEPDVGGSVGSAPPGRAEFLREVFANEGAVSRERLATARREREILLVTRAVALVEADIRRTTALTPLIVVELFDDGVVAATYNGSYQTPVICSIREPESICDVADNLRDQVVDELRQTRWCVWPACPIEGFGLDPRVIDGHAMWHCRTGGHTIAEIGRLPA